MKLNNIINESELNYLKKLENEFENDMNHINLSYLMNYMYKVSDKYNCTRIMFNSINLKLDSSYTFELFKFTINDKIYHIPQEFLNMIYILFVSIINQDQQRELNLTIYIKTLEIIKVIKYVEINQDKKIIETIEKIIENKCLKFKNSLYHRFCAIHQIEEWNIFKKNMDELYEEANETYMQYRQFGDKNIDLITQSILDSGNGMIIQSLENSFEAMVKIKEENTKIYFFKWFALRDESRYLNKALLFAKYIDRDKYELEYKIVLSKLKKLS